MNGDCVYAGACWRRSYSLYVLQQPYLVPPTRMTLFLAGFANQKMMPRSGIFCDNMPFFEGGFHNLCPAPSCQDCYEYLKELRRRERAERRPPFKKFNNQTPRVWLAPALKRAVALRDRHTCVYCRRSHNQISQGKKVRVVIDHFIPLAQGGAASDPCNLCVACVDCNRAKETAIWEKGCRIGFYEEK